MSNQKIIDRARNLFLTKCSERDDQLKGDIQNTFNNLGSRNILRSSIASNDISRVLSKEFKIRSDISWQSLYRSLEIGDVEVLETLNSDLKEELKLELNQQRQRLIDLIKSNLRNMRLLEYMKGIKSSLSQSQNQAISTYGAEIDLYVDNLNKLAMLKRLQEAVTRVDGTIPDKRKTSDVHTERKVKVFIGYATDDRKKTDTLRRVMKKTQCIEPIIIADRGKVGESLATKVENGIKKADCLMPILTTNSIWKQWVNQEIGYAKAKDRKIIPLVDEEVLHKLKGFIHDQMDLSLQFKSYESNPEKEMAEFRKCCWDAVDQILVGHLRINIPKGNKVKRQRVKVSGVGANPGDAIIVITSLKGKHLAPQAGGVVADGDGNWQLERCDLFNPGDRLVYALAIRSSDEDRVRELLEQSRRPPTANEMNKFARILESKGIGFKLSPGKRLIRTTS